MPSLAKPDTWASEGLDRSLLGCPEAGVPGRLCSAGAPGCKAHWAPGLNPQALVEGLLGRFWAGPHGSHDGKDESPESAEL